MCPMRFTNKSAVCPARTDPHGREAVRLLHVPDAVRQKEPRCAARAEPHGREAVRLLHVPDAVQRQEPPTSMGTGGLLLRSTATVHRRASALNSFEAGPTAALPVDAGGQEQGCPARVEPHGREAVRLLHLPDAFQPPERRCPARANPHRQEAPQILVLRQDVRADSPQHSTAPPHSTTTANERACFFLFLVLKTFSGTQTVRSHASCGSATEKTTLRHPDPTAS